MSTYTALDGALRLYDGTATPYYVQVKFDELNFTGPEGRPRTEETLRLHRGRHSTDSHYTSGPDTVILEPLECSFSFRMQNDADLEAKLRAALSNPDQGAAWTVDSDTWVTTKGDFNIINGTGTGVADPAFEDTRKVCVNVEVLYTKGGVSIGRKYGAVYFPADQISIAESEEGVVVSVTGMIYGLISRITSFTSGTES